MRILGIDAAYIHTSDPHLAPNDNEGLSKKSTVQATGCSLNPVAADTL
jgi:hypothetical protein